MGIAMISLGMVASFLTRNLTVGFILGAALNAPLAFFSNADVILFLLFRHRCDRCLHESDLNWAASLVGWPRWYFTSLALPCSSGDGGRDRCGGCFDRPT